MADEPYRNDLTMRQQHIPDTGLGVYKMPVQPPPPYPIGSVVRLKSGGPAMTVHYVTSDAVECCWFTADGKFGNSGFEAETLVLATPPQAAAVGAKQREPWLRSAGYDAAAAELDPRNVPQPAAAPQSGEIVVTEAMISDGINAWHSATGRGARAILLAIYTAMQAAAART